MRNYNNQTQNKKHLACLINFHKKIVIKFLCLAILASYTQNALANDTPNPADNTFLGKLFAKRLPVDDEAKFKIGINVGQVKDGYRTKNDLSILPHAFFDNHRWYVEGSEAGYYPYKDETHHFRVGLTYDGQSFDPRTTTDPALALIKDRDFSVLAHASFMKITPIGGFRAKLAIDALAHYEAMSGSLTHLSRFRFFDDKLTVYPSIGLAWYSKGYNQYYYGIAQSDLDNAPHLTTYTPKAGVNPYVSAMTEYTLNDQWSIFGHGRLEKLSKAQTDSPLVDGKVASTARLGVNFTF